MVTSFTGQRKVVDKSEKMARYESVTAYMATRLVTFKPNQHIREVIGVLLDKKISGAPVVDDNGDLVGILSEKDCLRGLIDSAYHNHPVTRSRVGDYMRQNVQTVSASMNVLEVANQFLKTNFRRFPVLDQGKLVGQISRRDILKAANNMKATTW